MHGTRIDQADPVLNLFAGLLGPAPWEGMLRALLARTRAQRVRLVLRHGEAAPDTALHCRVGAPAWQGPASAAEDALVDRLSTMPGLRPGRVYALEELRTASSGGWDGLLGAAQVGDARLLRIAGAEGHAAWLILLDQRAMFGAADSAQLTALIPAVQIAIGLLAGVDLLRVRAEAAEASLAALGIDQAVLDRQGQVLAGTGGAARATPVDQPGADGQLVPPMRAGEDWVLRRRLSAPAAALPPRAVAVAIQRPPRPINPTRIQPAVATIFSLSAQEARLASLLAGGLPLDQAGQRMGLAKETARSYAKKVYAKTGTSGQLELATRILASLAPLV